MKKALWIAVLTVMSAAAVPAATVPAAAQGVPMERSLHASKEQVEEALLKTGAAAAGRLPTVEGFAVTENEPTERFQRPRYTYSVHVAASPDGGCVVQVRAHITAWYAGSSRAQSGYRELTSSGRLESDLFERLEDLLKEPQLKEPQGQSQAPPALGAKAVASKPGAGAAFNVSRPGATVLPPRSGPDATVPATRDAANYAQSLREQAANLQEVLKNQTRPTDLAAVKQSRTPVYSRPSEQGDVLFLADAQDEFQVLNSSSEWVHVQISGLSRGWIRGPALELPSRAASAVRTGSESLAEGNLPFRLSRQEVNTYPGSWAALRGKSVRILSLEPSGTGPSSATQKWETARAMFRRAAARLAAQDADPSPRVEGVVLIFDSADGGMVSSTLPTLQDWSAGRLSDDAFRAQCSFDPPEAF